MFRLIAMQGRWPVSRVDVAQRLAAQEIGATVVDPRWVKPVRPDEIVDLARSHRLGHHRGQRA